METYKPKDGLSGAIRMCYYNLLLLNELSPADVSKESEVVTSFRKSHLNNIPFSTWNQGTILMGMYGLFVLPKEHYESISETDEPNRDKRKKILFDFLDSNLDEYFNFIESADHSKNPVVRFNRLRNAVAHGGISFDNESIVFVSKDPKKDYAIVQIAISDMIRLSNFLSYFGKMFINEFEPAFT